MSASKMSLKWKRIIQQNGKEDNLIHVERTNREKTFIFRCYELENNREQKREA